MALHYSASFGMKKYNFSFNSTKDNTLNGLALTICFYAGETDILNLLLKNGIDINVQANNGYSALHFASLKGECISRIKCFN